VVVMLIKTCAKDFVLEEMKEESWGETS